MIFLYILLLIVGMFFMIKGADLFVEGASKVAKAMKIPSLIIGLTLVSIGTSCPELSVSIQSALKGMNDMSFGNVIGSNIFNTFVVIGVSSIFVPMLVSKNMFKYDIPILIFIYILLILMGFVITPNVINFWEGLVLFLLMIAYTVFLIIRSKNEPQEEEKDDKPRKWYVNVLFIIIGLAGIIFGGDFVVDSASYIAKQLGMSDLLVGLTIVAIGTSLPELVTSMVAAKKGENDIAIGNAIGSSLFNVVLILSTSAMFSPMPIQMLQLFDVIVMLASAMMVLLFSAKKKEINRTGGIIFILVYVAYFTYIIIRNYI